MDVKKKNCFKKELEALYNTLPHKVTKVAFFMSQCHIE